MVSMTHSVPHSMLSKQLEPVHFFALSLGSIVVVGWMIVIGDWLHSTAPGGTIIAFLGGVLLPLIGLCYTELGSALPVAGGEVAYTQLAFGAFAAYVVVCFLSLAILLFAPLKRFHCAKYWDFSSPS